MRERRNLWRSLGLGILLSLVVAVAARAEPVAVRTSPHDGFGRIVFNWPSPVPYTAESAGGRVVIRFGRPIEAELGGVVRTLGTYLRGAAVGADGRSVVLTTTGDFAIRAFDLGAAVVLDLLEAAPAATAAAPAAATPATGPAAPAARPTAGPSPTPASAATAGPPLAVRTGEHDGYTRVVFDWPQSVGYTVNRGADAATILFDRPARPDLGALQSRPPKFIEGVEASVSGARLSVVLKIPRNSKVRDFRSGPKVVIDIQAPGPDAATGTPAKQPAPAPAAVAAVVAAPAQPAPITAPPPAVAAAAKPAGRPTPAPKPDAVPAPGQAAGRPTPLIPVTPSALSPPTEMATPQEGRRIGAAIPAVQMPSGSSTGPGGAVSMRFDWQEPVAAAVFRRADFLWVAFDKEKAFDLNALRTAGGNVIRGIEQMPVAKGAVLRLDTVSGINPSLRRDGLAWILDFRQQPLVTQTPIEAKSQTNSAAGARVLLPVPEPGAALAVADPEVGDTLVVVPVIPLGHGIGTPYDYPEFKVLPSSQGVVIQPIIDTLRVRPLRQGIELTSKGGLQISPVSAEAAAGTNLTASGPLTTIFDLERWRKGEPATFVAQEQKLQRVASFAKGADKEKARSDLASFYFAQGYGAEALGILEVMAAERPGIVDNPQFRALRGGSNFLMNRVAEANEDWYHANLNKNDEATFWRALLAVDKGDTVQASRVLRHLGSVIRSYPNALKIPLAMMVAEAAITVGDTQQASHYLELLSVEKPTPAQKAQIAYLEGRLMERSGDFDGAIGKWEEAERGPDRRARVKSAVARTELLLKLDKIGQAEAIDAYEKLRFAWRGDDFEFALLRRLGRLYLDGGDYRNGLRTLRQAATYFREHKDAAVVTQEMTDAFAKLFLENGADALPPVSAIALYEEFKELTPAGAKGDEMIRKLADRLVAVDLLDRGAELLQSQIEFRLQGAEKARVGAELALIRILANDPERALAALDASEVSGLPTNLVSHRRHLRARATMMAGQPDKALALLDKDETADADRIRTDLFWSKQDWGNAAQSLGRLVKATGVTPKLPLNDGQALVVLKLAIALTLSGNERGTNRARTDYATQMAATPYRDAFRLIASPAENGLLDYQAIAGKVKEAEKFQSFMADYWVRLKSGKLSELFADKTLVPTG